MLAHRYGPAISNAVTMIPAVAESLLPLLLELPMLGLGAT